jgi:hypothetical protein
MALRNESELVAVAVLTDIRDGMDWIHLAQDMDL